MAKKEPAKVEETSEGYRIYMVGPRSEDGKIPAMKDMRDDNGNIVVFANEDEGRKFLGKKKKLALYGVVIANAHIIR
jgi:hypothetical protein